MKSMGKKVFDVLVLLGVVALVFCIIYSFAMEAIYGQLVGQQTNQQTNQQTIGTLLNSEKKDEQNLEEELANIVQTEPRKAFTKDEVVDVVYVGNSLLQVPGIPSKVKQYAEKSGYTFVSHEYLLSGGTLKESLKRVKELEIMQEDLLAADVVVLQEYGSHYETTYEDICEFVKLCRADAEVYYYMTEFDFDTELLKKIALNERVHLIPATMMIEIAVEDLGYDYEEMTKPGDYHPSQTYAHLCGLFTFSMISGQKCLDYSLADGDKLLEYLKGETFEEKLDCFEKMYELADVMTGYYEEVVKTWD